MLSSEETLKMQTNEALVEALQREVEGELQGLVRRLAELEGRDEARLKELEREVLQAIFRLGRRWLGVVLAWRTAHEAAPAHRQGACGQRQRLVGWRPKRLLTLLGEVEWCRPYYHCQTEGAAPTGPAAVGHGEAPADARLGVQGRRTSAGGQEAVAFLGAYVPLEEVATNLARLLPLRLSARQVHALIQPVGEALAAREDAQVAALWVEAAQARTAQAPEEPVGEPIERLSVEMDGIMARLRRGSVPLEDQEAEREGDVSREVKVGAVVVGTRGPERSTLVPDQWVDTVDADATGATQYVARRTTADTFGPLLYHLAVQTGVRQAREVVVLGDGAPWIWRLADEHFPDAVPIVDLWHAQQPVWNVAHAVFGRGTAAGAAWAEDACSWLAHGQVDQLVAAIQALPPVPPEPGHVRSTPEVEADYFTTNAARMRYPAFRARGMQVGSGVAEAGCKTVVSTRAKRSGMRWSPAGLDALLPLRTAVLNGTYDAFWQVQTGVLT